MNSHFILLFYSVLEVFLCLWVLMQIWMKFLMADNSYINSNKDKNNVNEH